MILEAGQAHRDHGSDVRFRVGVGDGNRTRTISLGMSAGHLVTSIAAGRPDCGLSVSARQVP
jgi:hypothetical protein